MNRNHHIRRSAAALTGLTAAVVAYITGAPAALAASHHGSRGSLPARSNIAPRSDPPGWNKHPPLPAHVHTAVAGGMPGWQITLIVLGAALLTIAVALAITRVRLARRGMIASAT